MPEVKTGKPLSYHFDAPAGIWEASFPLGNGRLGLMPDGGVDTENIVLNEISMWSGSKQDTDNPQAYHSLGTIRKLLFEGCTILSSAKAKGADRGKEQMSRMAVTNC